MADEAALKLGSYVLLIELACGGMATVYIARQAGAAGFERLVTIKRVHRHLLKIQEFYDMFLDEARVASLIRHPNVVSVDDVVESADELFLVQPYIESVSLARLIEASKKKGERLPPALVVRIFADVLAGLSAAHDAMDMRGNKLEVVHRDVSPQNILVGSDGRSRIIDFGIAKAARRITTTSGGIMKGKLAYMSPEQARQQPVDARADLFAIGAVLHEALTGTQLFRGEDQADILLNVLIADIVKPSSVSPDVPAALDEVVRKSLEREPEARFQTAADLLESLEKALAPAQGRDVAQCVERLCGEELAVRRSAVRQSLDDPHPSIIQRLSPTPSLKDEATRAAASGSGRYSASIKSDVTMAATPALSDAGEQPGERPSRRRAALLAGLLGALAITAVGVTAALRGSGGAGSGSSETSPAGTVQITLTAGAPIESVTAEGLRSVDLEGQIAHITVVPWSGSLVVRAVLKGGASVSGVAEASGPRAVHLATTASASLTPTTMSSASAASAVSTAAPTGVRPSATAKEKTAPNAPIAPGTTGARAPGKPASTATTKAPHEGLKPNPFL